MSLQLSLGRSKVKKLLAAIGWVLILPAVIFAAWFGAAVAADSSVFPGPLESVARLTEDLSTPSFQASVWSTLQMLLYGWALAVLIGTLLGFALGLSKFWSEVFSTPLFALYSIPKVTLYPVFLLFLGIGDASRLAFAFFHGVFPIILLIMAATQSMDKNYLKLAKVLVMPWHLRVRVILIPALLPSIVTAIRIAFGLTLLGLILAEMFSAESGLGHELVANIANVRMDRIAGQVVFITIVAVIPGFTLRWMEKRVTSRYGALST